MRILTRLTTKVLIVHFLILSLTSYSQTVTDIDGNIYNIVDIGNQTWLKEDMRTLHYPDGSTISEAWSYNDDDSLSNIYGLLYTWDGAMNYTTEEKSQGICPDGWHIPSDAEWTELGTQLGGDNVAGGKLKEQGTSHWNTPNSGATNESGFTALPAGEYDDTHYQLLGEYNVIWSSTEASATYARYRYISYDDEGLHTYTYYKDFRYSVRCIKNETVGINSSYNKGLMIYPNPADMILNFDQNTAEDKNVTMYNQQGKMVKNFTLCKNKHAEDIHSLCSGIYLLKIENNGKIKYQKIIKK